MYLRLAIAAFVAVLLAGSHWKAYVMGKDVVRVEWQAEKARQEQQAENNRLLRQAAVNKTAVVFANSAAAKRQSTQSNLAKVDQYAPTTFPPLPGSFRVFHDAAATGEALNDSSGIDAPPVSLTATARTIAENYADANYDKQRLEALQQIVKVSGCFDVGE
ncbi:MAG TPA: hypothetical protein VJ654_17605 [Noviherbaspirillum sp.]|nr:hypothetical protein [Noviherbaspirillum sp.]